MARKPKSLVARAGSYFVAYRLADRGCRVKLTGRFSACLSVGSLDSERLVTVHVRTGDQARYRPKSRPEDAEWKWWLALNAGELGGELAFYAFVDLSGKNAEPGESVRMPDVFIVPADFVRTNLEPCPKAAKKPSSFWFHIPGKDKKKWHNAWHLIDGVRKAGVGKPKHVGSGCSGACCVHHVCRHWAVMCLNSRVESEGTK